MSLWVTITIIVAGSLLIPALLTLGIRRAFPSRDFLLSNNGGSPALRAITATYGLVLAFVLASSLQSFNAAQGQTVAEADAVVTIGNLARSLPTTKGAQLQADLTCYARSVVNVEFPAIEAGNTSQLDDDSALLRVYRSVSSLRTGSQSEAATAQAVTQQLSALTDARDARIRAARSSLPLLLWLLVAVGGTVVVLAVAAATYVDRPWPQFGVLVGVTAIILATIMLIVTLQQPFRSEGVHIDSSAMAAAMASVSRGIPAPAC